MRSNHINDVDDLCLIQVVMDQRTIRNKKTPWEYRLVQIAIINFQLHQAHNKCSLDLSGGQMLIMYNVAIKLLYHNHFNYQIPPWYVGVELMTYPCGDLKFETKSFYNSHEPLPYLRDLPNLTNSYIQSYIDSRIQMIACSYCMLTKATMHTFNAYMSYFA